MSTCSRCGGSVSNPTCYVCAEDDRDPYTEGMDAATCGQPKSSNPFSGQDASDWEEGWESIERDHPIKGL